MTKELIKWDKKSPINDVPAKTVIEGTPSWSNAELWLVKSGNRIERIEDVEIIRSNTGYEGTNDEVMNRWFEEINKPIEENSVE